MKKEQYEEAFENRPLGFMKKPYDDEPHYARIYRLATNNYQQNKKYLDVGPGYGRLYPWFEGEDYTGYDFTQRFIDYDKEHFPDGKWILGTIFDMPFKDQEFHVTMVKDVLGHVHPDRVDSGVKEILRVTKERVVFSLFRARTISNHEYYSTIRGNEELLVNTSVPRLVSVITENGFRSIQIQWWDRMQVLVIGDREID